MASISSHAKTNCHTRSISLPSLFDNKLYRLQQATSCSSSSSVIYHKLSGLNDMYESIESFLTFPTSQRLLGQKQQVNELLDELVELLDLCSTTKDALSMSMDAAKELQSVLRRKRGDNVELTSSVREYISLRKNVKNVIHKEISRLKKQGSLFTNEEEGTSSNVNVLKEMRPNTCTVFESLLTFISGSSLQSKPKGWLLVSKILGNKRVQCHQVLEKVEIRRVDDELLAVFSPKAKSASLDAEVIRGGLAEMEFTLQNLHQQVECIFRHLINTRVCLLNMYNC